MVGRVKMTETDSSSVVSSDKRAGVENIHREGQKQRKPELQHPNDSISPQLVTESLTSTAAVNVNSNQNSDQSVKEFAACKARAVSSVACYKMMRLRNESVQEEGRREPLPKPREEGAKCSGAEHCIRNPNNTVGYNLMGNRYQKMTCKGERPCRSLLQTRTVSLTKALQ
ncbi:hypothetical protein QYF61_002136, partial [Mycteria americana]